MTTELQVSDSPDIEAATVAAAHADADRRARAELETALGRLEAAGELNTAQRAVVERLAERLTDRLVATPLARASGSEAVTAGRLFLGGGADE